MLTFLLSIPADPSETRHIGVLIHREDLERATEVAESLVLGGPLDLIPAGRLHWNRNSRRHCARGCQKHAGKSRKAGQTWKVRRRYERRSQPQVMAQNCRHGRRERRAGRGQDARLALRWQIARWLDADREQRDLARKRRHHRCGSPGRQTHQRAGRCLGFSARPPSGFGDSGSGRLFAIGRECEGGRLRAGQGSEPGHLRTIGLRRGAVPRHRSAARDGAVTQAQSLRPATGAAEQAAARRCLSRRTGAEL